MNRVLAILLLFVMPLQLSFAMAAEYCDLATVDAGQHFGHHGHPDPIKSTGGNVPGDSHCALCHLGCAHATLPTLTVFVGCMDTVHATTPPPEPIGHSPPLFERPPRHALA